MKFIYIDESGPVKDHDVFVMCGLMIDAYKLRKATEDFDAKVWSFLLEHHPDVPKSLRCPANKPAGDPRAVLDVALRRRIELKTSSMLNGSGNWSDVCPDTRKNFVTELCELITECDVNLYGLALSVDKFRQALEDGDIRPFGKHYWIAAAMFISSLIQRKMSRISKGKGLTACFLDDNEGEMPHLSDALMNVDGWYDGISNTPKQQNSKRITSRRQPAGFNQIINAAFPIKSHHSSLVQAADAVCYVYRRHLELMDSPEAWNGEEKYYRSLVDKLEPRRKPLGKVQGSECLAFYQEVVHPGWTL